MADLADLSDFANVDPKEFAQLVKTTPDARMRSAPAVPASARNRLEVDLHAELRIDGVAGALHDGLLASGYGHLRAFACQ